MNLAAGSNVCRSVVLLRMPRRMICPTCDNTGVERCICGGVILCDLCDSLGYTDTLCSQCNDSSALTYQTKKRSVFVMILVVFWTPFIMIVNGLINFVVSLGSVFCRVGPGIGHDWIGGTHHCDRWGACDMWTCKKCRIKKEFPGWDGS